MKSLIIIGLFVIGSNAQIFSSGRCPDVETQKNFDTTAFGGIWHEVYRYENLPQLNNDCVKMMYSKNQDGFDVKMGVVKQGHYKEMSGSAIHDPNANGDGILMVEFPIDLSGEMLSVRYNILETDYDSYAVVQSCENVFTNHKAVYSWILARKDTLGPAAMLQINRVIAKNPTLSWGGYRKTSQDNSACFIVD